MLEHAGVQITWLGHDGFRLKKDKVLYLDPFQLTAAAEPADVGDTDAIPEMASLGSVDVALVPVSGTYVMTAAEAVTACNAIRPTLAIPKHYGSIVGTAADAEAFKKRALFRVEILQPES